MAEEVPMDEVGAGLRQRCSSTTATVTTPARGAGGSGPRSGDGDLAAGPARQLSLTATGFLPTACCFAPGLLLFSLLALVIVAALVSPPLFYVVTAVISVFALTWSTNLSISCGIGALWMRRDAGRDWHALFQQMQQERGFEECEVMHVVILPNYNEDEQMMRHTLENIGRSPMARECIRVVLAMEEREGPSGKRKAERLIAATSHLFSDIVASFHPQGLPGEVAGKSSNTQWAYREMLRLYAMDLARLDASRVFLTVGDADTLWHPQFFSALAYQALGLPTQQRAWSIWQPPVLLLRNLFSAPSPTRVSCYGTIFFELAGLANQYFSPHFCYSAYSLSLALASHPLVGGWDRDVIAEDHHMFCKCYFAAMWEAVDAPNREPIVPKVVLRPVMLPAVSYLVESDRGWLDSCWARFQQARRHSQGVAELSYVLLQYANLASTARLPLVTHSQILGMIVKMSTVHIINAVQAATMVVTAALLVPGLLSWAWSGGASALAEATTLSSWLSVVGSQIISRVGLRNMLAIFGPIPPVGMLMTAVAYLVVHDAITGRLTQVSEDEPRSGETRLAAPDVQGSAPCGPSGKPSSLSLRRKLSLLSMVQTDILGMAEVTLLAYGLVPVAMACWSLMRHGTSFDYIVAVKPQT